MRSSYLFTSESVSEGHPDKVSDQISDAIVDLFLSKDPEARIACETLTTTQLVVLAGEIRGKGIMDTEGNWAPGVKDEVEKAVRDTVKRIGYEQDGFHWETLRFENNLPPAVGAHRAGRGRGRQQGRGRRRPGHHVRLRRQRHAGPDAGDALLQPQDPRADGGRPPQRQGAVPRARHQEPGHAPLRRERPRRLHRGRRVVAARQGL